MWNKITGLTDASALLAQVFSSSDSTSVVTGTGICSNYVESARSNQSFGFSDAFLLECVRLIASFTDFHCC